MTSSQPYLLRALYEWILDNNTTPYILVNALYTGVQVPQEYVKDGQIVLNIAPSAVKALTLGNELLTFSARFRGIPMDISVPLPAVIGVYARENGRGMMFEEAGENVLDPESPPPSDPGSPPRGGKVSLRVVK